MINFRDLSIRKKLNLALMGISSAAVFLACISFYILVMDRYQRSYNHDLGSLAKVMGFNCRAALSFGINEDAEKVLTALKQRPSIVAAKIYGRQGELFAVYGSSSLIKDDPDLFTKSKLTIKQDSKNLLICQDIEVDGTLIGRIILLDNMESIHNFRKIALTTMAFIFFSIIGLSFLFATKLKEAIAKPISELDAISHEITKKQDYSLRAIKHSSDEVGHLVETFNKMLEQISERNKALLESEQRFRSLVDQAVDPFFLFDEEGFILDVNQRTCECLGYAKEELLSMSIADIDRKEEGLGLINQDKFTNFYARAGLESKSTVNLESEYKRKDGSTFPVEVRMGLLEIADQKVIMALARDISERLEGEKEKHQLENQLQQAQKMESLGTLAAGIAHDFNNILSPIYGYVELALMEVQDNTKVTGFLSEVEKAAHRAQDLVKQILTFSRRDIGQFSPVEIKLIVKEALKLLRSTIPSTIEIRQEIAPDCDYVMANPTQIHQIMMNLCTNAYYSMKETGGILGVSLEPVKISSHDLVHNINLRPGNYIRLEISDTGQGIAPENMEKIFEPYFTTKPHGVGTGMGLSVVHGIVKAHGGDITAYSEKGAGATFHVYLPVMEKEETKKAEPALSSQLPTGNEKILLVDDEKIVVNVEKEMMETLGYRVQTFTEPDKALEHFRKAPQAYDLVITDMTMPKMTGDILAKEILNLRADMPILLCTGFSNLVNKKTIQEMGIKSFLTKPIMISSLAKTVREVLDD